MSMPESNLFYPHRNFGGLSARFSSFDSSAVVILPVPYEGTVEWQAGTRAGPRAIIDVSPNLELYDFELQREIYKVGICTLPEVEPVMAGPEQMIDRVHRIAGDLIAAGKFVVTLGGEHSITLGIVRAHSEANRKFSVLQMDAHCDLRDEYLGTKYSYASVMRRVIEFCPVVQAGVRSFSLEEHEFLKGHTEGNIKTFYAQEVTLDDVFRRKLLDSLQENVYITIDLDVFDPAVMPSVTAPEPGGLTWQQVTDILRLVSVNRNIIGFDIMEFRPSCEASASAFTAAMLLYKLIGYACPGK